MHARGEHVVGPPGSIPVQFSRSVFLNGNAVVIDLDLDAIGLLPVLIDHIAQYNDGDAENTADDVE